VRKSYNHTRNRYDDIGEVENARGGCGGHGGSHVAYSSAGNILAVSHERFDDPLAVLASTASKSGDADVSSRGESVCTGHPLAPGTRPFSHQEIVSNWVGSDPSHLCKGDNKMSITID